MMYEPHSPDADALVQRITAAAAAAAAATATSTTTSSSSSSSSASSSSTSRYEHNRSASPSVSRRAVMNATASDYAVAEARRASPVEQLEQEQLQLQEPVVGLGRRMRSYKHARLHRKAPAVCEMEMPLSIEGIYPGKVVDGVPVRGRRVQLPVNRRKLEAEEDSDEEGAVVDPSLPVEIAEVAARLPAGLKVRRATKRKRSSEPAPTYAALAVSAAAEAQQGEREELLPASPTLYTLGCKWVARHVSRQPHRLLHGSTFVPTRFIPAQPRLLPPQRQSVHAKVVSKAKVDKDELVRLLSDKHKKRRTRASLVEEHLGRFRRWREFELAQRRQATLAAAKRIRGLVQAARLAEQNNN